MASGNNVTIGVGLDGIQDLLDDLNDLQNELDDVTQEMEDMRDAEEELNQQHQQMHDAAANAGAALGAVGREVIELSGIFEGAGEQVGAFIGALAEGDFAGIVTEGLGLIAQLLDDIAHASENAQEEYEKAMDGITKTSEKHRRDAAKGQVSTTGIQGGGGASPEDYQRAGEIQMTGGGTVGWAASQGMRILGSQYSPLNMGIQAMTGMDAGQMWRDTTQQMGRNTARVEKEARDNARKMEEDRKQREKDMIKQRKDIKAEYEQSDKETRAGREKAFKEQEKEKSKAIDKARKDRDAAEKKQQAFEKTKEAKTAAAEKGIAGATKSWDRRQQMKALQKKIPKNASARVSTGYQTLFDSMMKAGGQAGADKTRKQVQEEMAAQQQKWHDEDMTIRKEALQAIKDMKPAVALGANPYG